MNEKKILREEYKEILINITPERRFQAKKTLLHALKHDLAPFHKVLSFVSFKSEIDLSEINEFLLNEKKLTLANLPPPDCDCILVPGLAFDQKGYRLGRGKGHYDKLLAIYENIYTIGVCFQEQVALNDLPKEPHDQRVQKVCAF